jgi:hypothetical protein
MNPAITRTVKVIVRHSSECNDKSKGAEWRKCRCSKTLLVYEADRMNLTRADYLRAKIAKAQKELDTLAAAPARVGDKDVPSVPIGVPTHSGDLKHRTVLSLISVLDKFRSKGIRYELDVIPGMP